MANEKAGMGQETPRRTEAGAAGQGTSGGAAIQPGAAGQGQGQGAAQAQARGTRGMARRLDPLAGWLEPAMLGGPFASFAPFAMMRRMMEDLDRIFEGGGAMRMGAMEPRAGAIAFAPQVDVFRRDGSVVVRADLPGVSKEDLRIELLEDGLVLEGERREEQREEGEGYYRTERRLGTFRRVVPLPEGIEPEACQAHFDGGVLEVVLPIAQDRAQSRRIEIQEGKPSPGIH